MFREDGQRAPRPPVPAPLSLLPPAPDGAARPALPGLSADAALAGGGPPPGRGGVLGGWPPRPRAGGGGGPPPPPTLPGPGASAPPSARSWAQCVRDQLDGRFDCVTWAPLSARRLRQRGYDQARLLAEEAARVLEVPCPPPAEQDPGYPAPSPVWRRRASAGPTCWGVYRAPDAAAGLRVLLADDVVTTGSTLSECARILLTAGAAEVVCVTLAQARKDRPEKPRKTAK